MRMPDPRRMEQRAFLSETKCAHLESANQALEQQLLQYKALFAAAAEAQSAQSAHARASTADSTSAGGRDPGASFLPPGLVFAAPTLASAASRPPSSTVHHVPNAAGSSAKAATASSAPVEGHSGSADDDRARGIARAPHPPASPSNGMLDIDIGMHCFVADVLEWYRSKIMYMY
jgi:hypothetical protein